MAQSLNCPNCASRMATSVDEYNNRIAICPACGTTIDIPDGSNQQVNDYMQQLVQAATQGNNTASRTVVTTTSAQGSSSGCGIAIGILTALIIAGVAAFIIFSVDQAEFSELSVDGIMNDVLQPSSVDTLTAMRPVRVANEITAMDISPDGKLVAIVGEEGLFEIRDTTNFELVRSIEGVYRNNRNEPLDINDVAFSPDGQTIVVCGSGVYNLQFWSVEGERLSIIESQTSTANHLEFTPDGSQILWISSQNPPHIFIANLSDKRIVGDITVPSYSSQFTINPTGELVAAVAQQKGIYIWQIADGELVRSIQDEALQSTISFSPSGDYLATVDHFNDIRVYKTENWKLEHTLTTNFTVFSPRSLAFDETGRYLAAGSFFDNGAVWDVEGGELLFQIEDLEEVTGLILSSAGDFLLTTGGNYRVETDLGEGNILRVWDVDIP